MSTESLEAFAKRAATWAEANLPSVEDDRVDDRELQRAIFDGGFAGLAFPEEYGGAGLTLEHQMAFYDAADHLRRQVRTTLRTAISTIGPTMLTHASHEAKVRFLPPMLRGDQEWVQLLSEPRGGSDMAGAVTRLTRDGDTYVLNGAKMWSSGAHVADWSICLCRTNWDLPKHQGLSMIALPLKQTPGLTINQIRAASGQLGDFCEEFFDNVVLPKEYLIGDENEGWMVARTLLFHERCYHGNVGYGYGGARERSSSSYYGKVLSPAELVAAAERRGVLDEMAPIIADAFIESIVGPLTEGRINSGMGVGTHQGPWGSLLKLQWSVGNHQAVRTELSVLGPEAVIWDGEDIDLDNTGTTWIFSRARRIAGGSSEMQRNTISERLLGLPRDPFSDRDIPFRELHPIQGG